MNEFCKTFLWENDHAISSWLNEWMIMQSTLYTTIIMSFWVKFKMSIIYKFISHLIYRRWTQGWYLLIEFSLSINFFIKLLD